MYETEIDRLRDKLEPNFRPAFDDFSRGFHGNYTPDPIGKHVSKYEKEFEAAREYTKLLDALYAERAKIERAVQLITQSEYRVILFGRYVQLRNLREMQEELRHCRSRFYELHKAAFLELMEVLKYG
jgi:hypothetical protein